MFNKLVSTLVLLGVAYIVVNSIPDVARYIKIRDL